MSAAIYSTQNVNVNVITPWAREPGDQEVAAWSLDAAHQFSDLNFKSR